jgi:O-antigen/teichoic acid export membrane protein
MSGHERDSLRGMLAAAMINIVGGVIFIPLYGIQGAAFVNAFSLISCNLLLRHYVMRRLSVESTVLGGIARIYRKLRINWGART